MSLPAHYLLFRSAHSDTTSDPTKRYVRGLEDEVKRLAALEDCLARGQLDACSGGSLIRSSPRELSSTTTEAVSTSEPQHHPQQRQPNGDSTLGTGSVSQNKTHNSRQEVSGVNQHTQNVEFYGSSSAVALLSHVQRAGDESTITAEGEDAGAIVSSLHNPAFSPSVDQPTPEQACTKNSPAGPGSARHYPQCRVFHLHFFSSIHYVHPILSKSEFLDRCEKLQSGEGPAKETSFEALYYSLLSLGALIGPRDEDPVDGISNMQWSRRFFDEAVRRCNRLGMVTDLDMVQCYVFLVGELFLMREFLLTFHTGQNMSK